MGEQEPRGTNHLMEPCSFFIFMYSLGEEDDIECLTRSWEVFSQKQAREEIKEKNSYVEQQFISRQTLDWKDEE